MPASTTRRKPPARKPVVKATPRSVIDAARDGDEFEPLRLSSAEELPEPERTTIAYLDDYALTMPTEVPPNVTLRIMRTARRRGDDAAMIEMLEEVIGEEGFDRLVNHQGLTTENLVDLFEVVQRGAMGRFETPKASSRNV
jgi:hypothetical protein